MPYHPTKKLEIIAGPNGSGKTTFAQAYFRLRNGQSRFINADTIASGLAAGNEAQAAFHAGRVMLEAIEEALEEGKSFAFESTLAGRTWIKLLETAKRAGYSITIYFVYLERPSLNLQRIRQRVKEGGHSIPKETVLRRYSRSFENFWKIYLPLCDDWFVFNNSGKTPQQIQDKKSYDRLSLEEKIRFQNLLLKVGKAS